jgi:signal transduction histidine kinase
MIYRGLMTLTAVFGLILILFALNGPMLLPYLGDGALPPPTQGNLTVWSAISFTRLFGAMLFTIGVIAWTLRNLDSPEDQRSAGLAFFIGSLFLLFFALIQQIAIWVTTLGWIAVSVISIFPLGFGYLLFVKFDFTHFRFLNPAQDTEKLRQRWIRQLSEAAAQQERNRLARDLHDSIKQQIFSINVSAAAAQERWAIDSAGALQALENVRNSAREAMTEMEAMLQQLRPVPLENTGLVEALRKQAEALQYRTGAYVTTEFGELPDSDTLTPNSQEAIFRIAQEALSNIARHARAKNVRLRLYQQCDGEKPVLWFKVEDDGNGFDTTRPATGMGLTNINVRTAEIGGLLHIESAPGEGTNLVVSIPIISPDINKLRRMCYAGQVYIFAVIFLFGLLGQYLKDGWSILLTTLIAIGPFIYIRAIAENKLLENFKSMKNVPLKVPLELIRYLRQTWLFILALFMSLVTTQRNGEVDYTKVFLMIGFSLYPMIQIHDSMKELKEKLSAIDFQQSIDQMRKETIITLMFLIPLVVTLSWWNHEFWGILSIPSSVLYLVYVACWRGRSHSKTT